MENEIIKLQEIISHQSEDMQRLNEEIYAQQKEIRNLQEQITKIQAQIKNLTQNSNDSSQDIRPFNVLDDKPPHY